MNYNKLIAEFMEINVITLDDVRKNKDPYISSADGYLEDDLKYHCSWDWLMTVVEKIESDERYDVDILQYGTRIREGQKDIVNNIADISFDKKINHTYEAVVQFIKMHNLNVSLDNYSLVLATILKRCGSLDNLICELREDADVVYVNIADDIDDVLNEYEVEEIINKIITQEYESKFRR